jgi:hypothetical protein
VVNFGFKCLWEQKQRVKTRRETEMERQKERRMDRQMEMQEQWEGARWRQKAWSACLVLLLAFAV